MTTVRTCLLPALVASALLAGCAGNPLRSYDKEMGDTISLVRSGELDNALAQLEKNNTSKDKDILYYLEKGEVLYLNNQYGDSLNTWLQGDEIVRIWEDEFKTNPTKVISDIASFIVNDSTRRYDGQDYEKVFLNTKLALDHIMLGNDDLARIEMKKTFERETLIKQFREMEYEKIKEEGDKRSIAIKPSALLDKGYPMDRLDNPEVNTLKNGYQNAFAHYLAGYYFEMKGEPSLSAPGYKNALELRPDSALAKEKASGKSRSKPSASEADVLFVIESGQAPAWKSLTIPLPLPIEKELIVVPLSFPLVISSTSYTPQAIRVGGRSLPVETLVNVDAMAKRQLKDQLPGIIGRTAIRGVLKGAAQYAAQKKGGKLVGALTAVGMTATETADERAWRTLPSRVSIARAVLPKGENTVEFRTAGSIWRGTVVVGNGDVNIVPIRLIGNVAYIGQQNVKGQYTALSASEVFQEGVEEELPVIKNTEEAPASDTKKSGGLSLPKLR